MARATRSRSVLDYALLVSCVVGSLLMIFLPDARRDETAAALRRTIVAPFASLQRGAQERRAAFLSYGARVRDLGTDAQSRAELVALTTENARLRAMLGLGSRLGWGFIAAEASPAQLESDLVRQQLVQTFTVSAGSGAGVQPFTPVVAPEGLVGMVQLVDPASSMAITYSHPDFRVSATTPNDSAFGIVQASLSSGSRGLLEMRGVPFRSPLKAGTLIISSGLGGTYPRGIAVGTVIREIQTTEKWARTYLLQPTASLANVGPVFLMLKQRGDSGVARVWMSAAAADSAARSIAAAGDSLAREAAMREMAARRAALDSTRDSTLVDSTGAPIPAPSTAGQPAVPPTVPPTGQPTVPAPTTAPATVPSRPAADSVPRAARPTVPAPTSRPTVPRPTVPRPTVPAPIEPPASRNPTVPRP